MEGWRQVAVSVECQPDGAVPEQVLDTFGCMPASKRMLAVVCLSRTIKHQPNGKMGLWPINDLRGLFWTASGSA
jgi:hypothetical protein